MPTQRDLSIRRGETFGLAVRWESDLWLYSAIAAISKTAPVRITHAGAASPIPDGWEVAVVDAQGLAQLNATSNPPKPKDMRRATVLSATEIEFNPISAAAYGAHRAGTGYLAWRAPHALAGYRARMQIKDRVGGVVLFTLTSDPDGGITLDDANKVVELTLSALQTEAVLKSGAAYDLELVSPAGTVTALLAGAITFGEEITTIT